MYINYKCPYTGNIETIENIKGLSKVERKNIIENYNSVSSDYYVSSRATRQYYEEKKKSITKEV